MPRRRRTIYAKPRRRGSSARWVVVVVLLAAGVAAWVWRAHLLPSAPAPVVASPVTPVARPPAPAPAPAATPAEPAPAAVFVPPPPPLPAPPVADATGYPRFAANLLEAQIVLARRHISSGAIDGVAGAQTAAALAAFQESAGLAPTGRLDDPTRARLVLDAPAFAGRALGPADFEGLQALAPTWLGKSAQTALAHESLLERLAEQTQAHPNLLRRLNPAVDWAAAAAGAVVNLPVVPRPAPAAPVAHLHVRLAERILQARAADGTLLAHFPVSIAKRVDKRPVGALRVTVVVPDPNYTFDPAVFPESAEARELGRKLILPPGANNPVGVAWIGLDRTGYGIHGTPLPEQVGRTESHGCFRLANWDARALLGFVRPGLPVYVEP